MFSRRVWPASTSTSRCSVLKPCAFTVSVYLPVASLEKRKLPCASEVVVCAGLSELGLSRDASVTSAEGTRAPKGSSTMPVTVPVLTCATAHQQASRAIDSHSAARRNDSPRDKGQNSCIGGDASLHLIKQ